MIDSEIRDIIERNYERAKTILNEDMDKLHAMAKALMKYETIDAKQIDDIMKGEEPQPPADWSEKASADDASGESEVNKQAPSQEPEDKPSERQSDD